MANQRGRPYESDEIIKRIPVDHGDLFRGVVAWQEDVGAFRRTIRENLEETSDRIVRRTIWDDPEGNDARVAIDIVECSSATAAVAALMDRLEWNQLAVVPPGPRDLGVASFTHPKGAPPAIFFARDNLCISVLSFARRAVAVQGLAEALDRRLSRTPPAGGPSLPVERGAPDRGATPLRVSLPFPLAEEGYLRYRARGGTLAIRDDQVVAIPVGRAEMQVDVYAIEPGRPAAAGRVVVPQ